MIFAEIKDIISIDCDNLSKFYPESLEFIISLDVEIGDKVNKRASIFD